MKHASQFFITLLWDVEVTKVCYCGQYMFVIFEKV